MEELLTDEQMKRLGLEEYVVVINTYLKVKESSDKYKIRNDSIRDKKYKVGIKYRVESEPGDPYIYEKLFCKTEK